MYLIYFSVIRVADQFLEVQCPRGSEQCSDTHPGLEIVDMLPPCDDDNRFSYACHVPFCQNLRKERVGGW